MTQPEWTVELQRRSLKTKRMILNPGDPGQVAGTKVGGVPWWPGGLARPKCADGHDIGFVAQILLGDVAQLSSDAGMLSFHYCDACAYDGRMSWGRGDVGHDLRIFKGVADAQPDGRGVVAKSSIPPRHVSLSSVDEIPGFEDTDEELRARIPRGASTAKDDFDEHAYNGLIHVMRCKVGGWPSWVQSPEWPECPESGRMVFVAQLDWDLGREAAWAGGGYAYLFACPNSCRARSAELVIQTT